MSVVVDLTDRVVIVTGAAGGLGSACARRFMDAGARVALVDLNASALETFVNDAGERSKAWAVDLSDRSECRLLVEEVMGEFGRIDVLIACAGVMQTKPFLDLSETDWRNVVDVNLTGTFFLVQAVAEQMLAAGGGSIVIYSSVAGRSGRPLAPHYAASKAGLLSLTKSAALAFAPSVRVNAICPGVVITSMWEAIMADRDALFGEGAGEEYRQQVETSAPLGRSADPTEIANAALFLASDLASYITGQALNVDGGIEMD